MDEVIVPLSAVWCSLSRCWPFQAGEKVSSCKHELKINSVSRSVVFGEHLTKTVLSFAII